MEVRPEHAEGIHYLVIIQIPNSLHGSVDTPASVQFFKSRKYVFLINTESKCRYRQHQEDGSESWIVMSRGPHRYAGESWHDPDNSPESCELASHTSVGRPHAIDDQALGRLMRQPETQLDLMNNHSEDFIPIDKRKWYDFLAYGDVKGKTLEWNISNMVTNLVRHLDLEDRETDGAGHWKSMCPLDYYTEH